MDPTQGGLSEIAVHFKRAAQDVLDTYASRKPAVSNQVTPPPLVEALEQLLAIIIKLERQENERPVPSGDVDELGEYGLSLLSDLATWAQQLGMSKARMEIESISLAIADWIIRHHGRISTLEPVVNALAARANATREPQALERLANFMTHVIAAASDSTKADLEKTNPGRPWRLLHLNRGIVATRSHNLALMEQVFDDIVRYLPDDAPRFFDEGMQQMVLLNYPQPVRDLVQRYHSAWSRRDLH